MNHPQEDVLEEIRWMSDMGLEFLDLTLEPPRSAPWQVDPEKIRKALEERNMDVVGHTAYYLPIGSPFEEVRKGAVRELSRCLEIFGIVGARWMNIHPDRYAPMHPRSFFIQRDLESLRELQEVGERVGVGLMIENIPGDFNTVEELADLLDPMPELGLHLDVGHSNLRVPSNTACAVIQAFGNRLKHVHLHDNKGGYADLHLPLGAGNIDIPACISAIKHAGYDGTITLEVFTPDRNFLEYSMMELRRMWAEH
jgi:sugar phosphate isomerase/epimerase